MLKSAAFLVMIVAAAPAAIAQEGARADIATVKKLVAQAAMLLKRDPADLALAVAQPSLADEVAQALRARPAPALKVAPR
ncbi:MAG TPA: hypothetical protein VHB97_22140 [Polyangia bacterium]|nr:hypothetical protein [Polyangia bacterium]